MRGNTVAYLLAAYLLLNWRCGCPKILYTHRGGNLLSFLAYKVYQRLRITKASGSSHRHNTSGMFERTIHSVLTMLHLRHGRPAASYHLVRARASHSLEFEYFGLSSDGL